MKTLVVVAALGICLVGSALVYREFLSNPGTPLEGTNPDKVYVTIEAEGSATVPASDTPATNIVRNVFAKTLGEKDVDVSKIASGGQVRVWPGRIMKPAGRRQIIYLVTIPKAGQYVCWLRGLGGVCNHDTAQLVVNFDQNGKNDNAGLFKLNEKMAWQKPIDAPTPVELKADTVAIHVTGGGCCEQELGLDRILITNDVNYVPRP